MAVLAVDLGTSNTVLARWDAALAAPTSLRLPALSAPPLAQQPSVVPSLLYVEDAAARRVLAGAQVRDAGRDVAGDGRFFRGFKRAIAAEVEGFAPRLDGCELTPALAGELFLGRVLEAARAEGEALETVVFSVPVGAFERYAHWLGAAAARAGVAHWRLLDESTAAALGYAVHAPDEPVLVVDFGGGTLDISLVRLPAGPLGVSGRAEPQGPASPGRSAQVLAKAGAVLGGEDIDAWLVADFAARHGLAADELEREHGQLAMLAEHVKMKLSSEPSADLTYFSPERLKAYQTTYSRGELEDLLDARGFYRKLQSTLESVLRHAEGRGLSREGIRHVLLVGGTTLIPSVQRAVRQNFDPERVLAHRPFEAVAHGALQLARGVSLDDMLFHGYGVRYWDARLGRHAYEPIVAPGQRYPTSEPIELVLRASRPAQSAIELVIGEWEPGGSGAAEVVFAGKKLVATPFASGDGRVVALNDAEGAKTIATLEPPGFPGVDRIRVRFRVDAERRLRLSVTDLLSDTCLLDDVAVVELR